MAIKKLDLHSIAHNSEAIEKALISAFKEAFEEHIPLLEIIPGKGTGQLKKRVIRFLGQTEIKNMYKRYKVDPKNFGCIMVYMKEKE